MVKLQIKNQSNEITCNMMFHTEADANAFALANVKAGETFEILDDVVLQPSQEILDSARAKMYLRETDFVVIKIMEASIEGNQAQVNALKAQYAAVLAKRISERAKVI